MVYMYGKTQKLLGGPPGGHGIHLIHLMGRASTVLLYISLQLGHKAL